METMKMSNMNLTILVGKTFGIERTDFLEEGRPSKGSFWSIKCHMIISQLAIIVLLGSCGNLLKLEQDFQISKHLKRRNLSQSLIKDSFTTE